LTLTQAELDIIHAVLDARRLNEHEAEQLEREATEGGGPLTDELTAAVRQALQEAQQHRRIERGGGRGSSAVYSAC